MTGFCGVNERNNEKVHRSISTLVDVWLSVQCERYCENKKGIDMEVVYAYKMLCKYIYHDIIKCLMLTLTSRWNAYLAFKFVCNIVSLPIPPSLLTHRHWGNASKAKPDVTKIYYNS